MRPQKPKKNLHITHVHCIHKIRLYLYSAGPDHTIFNLSSIRLLINCNLIKSMFVHDEREMLIVFIGKPIFVTKKKETS